MREEHVGGQNSCPKGPSELSAGNWHGNLSLVTRSSLSIGVRVPLKTLATTDRGMSSGIGVQRKTLEISCALYSINHEATSPPASCSTLNLESESCVLPPVCYLKGNDVPCLHTHIHIHQHKATVSDSFTGKGSLMSLHISTHGVHWWHVLESGLRT